MTRERLTKMMQGIPMEHFHIEDSLQTGATARASRPRVLLIDDSPTQLTALVRVLQDHCEIQVATDGRQGLALASAGPVDMILLDVQMPGMDGHAVARALRDEPATRHIPFIFLTVDDASQAERLGLELGATDYIAKPVNGEVALRRVLNHLEREQLRQQIEAERAQLEVQVAQRTADLARAKDEAEAASRLKDAILRNLSHELRTPLNGILGMLQVSQAKTTDDSARQRMALAEEAAWRLLDVLSGLIDLAQLEAGVLRPQVAPYRIADVVDHIATTLRPLAKGSGLVLETSMDAACRSLSCMGDRDRVEQILTELVRNAIKFTKVGTVTLHARVVDRIGSLPHMERELRVSVADNGPGVDASLGQQIYAPFFQGDASMGRFAEGNGVGLALARGLAKLMGGSVELESNSSKGATFALCLPCPRHSEP